MPYVGRWTKLRRCTLLVMILTFLCTQKSFAQHENVWMFGDNAGIDFNGAAPVAIQSYFEALMSPRKVFGEANASVCNTEGELLFYTEGTMIINRQHQIMANGDSLIPYLVAAPNDYSSTSSASQGTIIVPVPGQSSLYYVFSLIANEGYRAGMNGHLYYSLINMDADSGLGAVVAGQKGILLDTGLTEHMTAVAADDYRIWLLTISRVTEYIKAFEITACGINTSPVSSGPFPGFFPVSAKKEYSGSGYLSVAPNRTMGAICGTNYRINDGYGERNGLVTFSFDTLTGVASNLQRLSSGSIYGICFSPDNTKLYASYIGGALKQFDLSAGSLDDIKKSETQLFDGKWHDGVEKGAYGHLKLAPDNKIYFPGGHASYFSLGVINFPDRTGMDCDPQAEAIKFPKGITRIHLGLTHIIVPRRSVSGMVLESDTGCAPYTAAFSIAEEHLVEYSTWDFGDGSPLSNQINPSHTYMTQGSYEVTLYVKYKNRPCIDTSHKTITVLEVFKPKLAVKDTLICSSENFIDIGVQVHNPTPNNILSWSPLDGITTSPNDSVITVDLSKNTTYYVTVTDTIPGICGISSTDTVYIDVAPRILDIITNDTLVCEGIELPVLVNGTPKYSYQWTPSDGVTNPTDQSPVIKTDQSMTYTVVASYTGCPDTAQSITIEVEALTGSSFLMQPDSICTGESITFYPKVDNKNSALRGWHWQFGDGKELPMHDEPVIHHAYEQPGVFPVMLTSHFRVCPDSTFMDTVYVFALPRVDLGSNTGLCLSGSPIFLKNLQAPEEGTYRSLWNTGDTTGSIRVAHPGTYSLTVINDPLGCSTTESIKITRDCYIDIPNAFTPDGDGVNDYFFPRQLLSKSITRFHMQVYNRWGQVVFETTRLDGRGWDGKFNGKDQPQGVYVYRIDAEIDDEKSEKYEGNVTLIR